MKRYPRRLGWFTKVYATSDGRAFTDINKAESHQNELDADRFVRDLKDYSLQYHFDKPEDYYTFMKCLGLKDVQSTISRILRSKS